MLNSPIPPLSPLPLQGRGEDSGNFIVWRAYRPPNNKISDLTPLPHFGGGAGGGGIGTRAHIKVEVRCITPEGEEMRLDEQHGS